VPHQSPQWRWIEDVEGNPGDRMRRGEQIKEPGTEMRAGFAPITAVNRLAGLRPGTLSHAPSWTATGNGSEPWTGQHPVLDILW